MTGEQLYKLYVQKQEDLNGTIIEEPFDELEDEQYVWEDLAKLIPPGDKLPNLGLATTGEMLDEIKTRLEVADVLDYRTTDI